MFDSALKSEKYFGFFMENFTKFMFKNYVYSDSKQILRIRMKIHLKIIVDL